MAIEVLRISKTTEANGVVPNRASLVYFLDDKSLGLINRDANNDGK